MGDGGFFFQAFVYLAAAVVSVPIAKRLGLGSVLGYLIAGVAVGPFGLNFVGEKGQDIMHFAEFGVVMMLFLVGLELQPALLWRMRAPILGLGGLQVTVTAAAIGGVGMALGLAWPSALAVGLILALSSTAIVLQTLNEKGLMQTRAGKSAFSVLLFQDIAVIPILAVLPLLAITGTGHGSETHEETHLATTWVEGMPAWGQTLAVLGAVAVVILAGRFLIVPAFRIIARTRLRELFTAAALLLVIGIALLMTRVGLSPALGTFLAGVVLANSEYRHALEIDIEPFKGLLLGLFFIAVGASIDFTLIATEPATIGGLVAALIVIKLLVLVVLGKVFKLSLDQNLIFALGLAQGGEFAFVLFSFATQNRVLDDALVAPLVAVVAVSMALAPLLMLFNEKLLQPRFGTKEVEREPDEMDEHNPVIVAGFGRFGHVVGRLLLANGVGTTVLDVDSDQVDLVRKLGIKAFYGDAGRADLLRAAGADSAKLLVIAVDGRDKALEIVKVAQEHFPNLRILCRAFGRSHAYRLLDAGVESIYRETLDTSLRVGVDALCVLGYRRHQALRAARKFRRHDEESVRELAGVRDRKSYVIRARQLIRSVESLIREEVEQGRHPDLDAAWDSSTLLNEFGEKIEEDREP